jgi:hypothetical protein
MGSSTSTAEYLATPSPVSAYRGRLTTDVGRAFYIFISSWFPFLRFVLFFAGALDGSYLTRLVSDDNLFED